MPPAKQRPPPDVVVTAAKERLPSPVRQEEPLATPVLARGIGLTQDQVALPQVGAPLPAPEQPLLSLVRVEAVRLLLLAWVPLRSDPVLSQVGGDRVILPPAQGVGSASGPPVWAYCWHLDFGPRRLHSDRPTSVGSEIGGTRSPRLGPETRIRGVSWGDYFQNDTSVPPPPPFHLHRTPLFWLSCGPPSRCLPRPPHTLLRCTRPS